MDIHHQDKYLIIINKEAGLMVEPDRHGYPNVQDKVTALLSGTQKKSFVQPVHRIDRPVSGLVLFALKPSALKILNEQFASRTVEKIYLAITEHAPGNSKGKLQHYLWKDAGNKKAVVTDLKSRSSAAVELDYGIIASRNGLYLWKINLGTGKYHQIRAQLAHIGCPILGDIKYGSKYKYFKDAIALHAYQLAFDHPQSHERMTMIAAPPRNKVWDMFSELVKNAGEDYKTK